MRHSSWWKLPAWSLLAGLTVGTAHAQDFVPWANDFGNPAQALVSPNLVPPPKVRPAPKRAAVNEVWTITPADRTLRLALTRLATSAGWQLSWELESDIAIAATASVEGDFEDLIAAVADATGVQFRIYRGNRAVVARDKPQ